MSISLAVTRSRDTASPDWHPVATQAAYRGIWLVAAADLGLRLIGSLEDRSDDLTPSQVQELLGELRAFRDWLATRHDDRMLERVDSLIDFVVGEVRRDKGVTLSVI